MLYINSILVIIFYLKEDKYLVLYLLNIRYNYITKQKIIIDN